MRQTTETAEVKVSYVDAITQPNMQELAALKERINGYKELGVQSLLQVLYDEQRSEDRQRKNAVLIADASNGNAIGTYLRHDSFREVYEKAAQHVMDHGVLYQRVQTGLNGKMHAHMSRAALAGFFAYKNPNIVVLDEMRTLMFHHRLAENELHRNVGLYADLFQVTLPFMSVPDGDIIMPYGRQDKLKVAAFAEYTTHKDEEKFENQAAAYQAKIDRYRAFGSCDGMLFTDTPPVAFMTASFDSKNFMGSLRNSKWASFGWAYTLPEYATFVKQVAKTLETPTTVERNIQRLQSFYPVR